jgi:hypothetical protein
MPLTPQNFHAIRNAVAAIPGDVSHDAVGAYAPQPADMYAPSTHAAALDPTTPIVIGARGTGKSFWSGVLGQPETLQAAAQAFPNLKLGDVRVRFGFTAVGGPGGVNTEALNQYVSESADVSQARAFWWATVVRATLQDADESINWGQAVETAADWERREELLAKHDARLRGEGKTLLIVYDALDRITNDWGRRRLLMEALLEVVWAMRAYRNLRVKLFLRPDMLEDESLRFVELPKLRAGAVRLTWSPLDLYGMFFSRLALSGDDEAREAFATLLRDLHLPIPVQTDVLSHRWPLTKSEDAQKSVMRIMAGEFMAEGKFGYKKGNTYDWPINHLADAFREVTPRSFLGLMIGAAKFGPPPDDRVITANGILNGVRAASKTRVDQLHQEFPWIKGVLAPLAGLLMPTKQPDEVYDVWRRAGTIKAVIEDSRNKGYLPPFPITEGVSEHDLFIAMQDIGVMSRRMGGRKDPPGYFRIDMPDLFRVAAKLLKKGAVAPL